MLVICGGRAVIEYQVADPVVVTTYINFKGQPGFGKIAKKVGSRWFVKIVHATGLFESKYVLCTEEQLTWGGPFGEHVNNKPRYGKNPGERNWKYE